LLGLEEDDFFCGDRESDLLDRGDGISSSLGVDVVFFGFLEKMFIEKRRRTSSRDRSVRCDVGSRCCRFRKESNGINTGIIKELQDSNYLKVEYSRDNPSNWR